MEFTSPPLVNPLGFTAQHRGLGNLDFRWRPVPGALRYRLDGPGIPNTGFYTKDTITSYPKIPGGPNTWKLTALYQGNYADYANPSIASAVVRVLPPHATPWLSKNNGPNSAAIFQAPKRMFNFSGFFKDNVDFDIRSSDITCSDPAFRHFVLDSSYSAQEARSLREDGFACNSTGPAKLAIERIGLQHWVHTYDLPLWRDSAQILAVEAVYGNAVDLGVGRRAQCAVSHDAPPHTITTCYATAHGIVPGQPGFNNLNTITHPGEGIGDDFILSMVISKDLTGTTFLVFLRDSVLSYGKLAQKVSLDTEGPKFVPQVCMSCHGGKYNPTTRKVDGASFLPLDPGLLGVRVAGQRDAGREHSRHRHDDRQLCSDVGRRDVYSRPLWKRCRHTRHAREGGLCAAGLGAANRFYRSVVKPYCATCHLTAPESWNFASWSNFQDNAALIRAAVCSAHTMPHAELQYKAFWTKATAGLHAWLAGGDARLSELFHLSRHAFLITPSTAEEARRSARSHHPSGRAQSRTESTGEIADTRAFGRPCLAPTPTGEKP